jgi:hypothetical protein
VTNLLITVAKEEPKVTAPSNENNNNNSNNNNNNTNNDQVDELDADTQDSQDSSDNQEKASKDEGDEKNSTNNKSNKAKSAAITNNNNTTTTTNNSKTWTCQMCKKQFDQRVDLNKHACIELNLRLLKKKKEMRKKKCREAHWKRKIDLSYIETTSLTHISQNIADNLSFCIDGTIEDLKSYSREVKDYLGTELGSETHLQMFMKSCFPELVDTFVGSHYQSSRANNSSNSAINGPNSLDSNVLAKANSYFTDSNIQYSNGYII